MQISFKTSQDDRKTVDLNASILFVYCRQFNSVLSVNAAPSWSDTGNNKNTTGDCCLRTRKEREVGSASGKNSVVHSKTCSEGRLFIKTALSWPSPLEPSDHMRCSGSEVLAQSRAHAHESGLTDLHIACERTASRDSGTDASQANAASAAGSAARRHGACSGAAPPGGGCLIPCCNTVGENYQSVLQSVGIVCFPILGGVWPTPAARIRSAGRRGVAVRDVRAAAPRDVSLSG